MHWAQGAERAASAATKVMLLQLWSRNFLFGVAVRQLLPAASSAQASCESDRQTSLIWSGVRAYPQKKNGLEGYS